jgi:hypothetical protein
MVNMDIPTISKIIFEAKILLSRKSLDEISGNLVFLSKNKKAIKLEMKTAKENKDVSGILMKFDRVSLVSRLSVLRKVMNNRKVIMLTPNSIAPLRSNFSFDSFSLIFESRAALFSVGMNFIMTIIKQIAIGIIEINVNLQS